MERPEHGRFALYGLSVTAREPSDIGVGMDSVVIQTSAVYLKFLQHKLQIRSGISNRVAALAVIGLPAV